MNRLLLFAIVVVAVIGIGATFWIIVGRAPAPGGDFFEVPQEYPTSGGQDLQPNWNASGEAPDAAAN